MGFKLKSEIRPRILGQLKLISSEQRVQKSKAIESNLQSLLKNQTGFWSAYQSLSDEPVIDWPNVSTDITWCFPVVKGEVLEFKTANVSFKASSLGVREPSDGKDVPLKDLNGLLIPAIAYSKTGYRLGRGGGYFDRTLAKYAGKKIGICYELSLCEELPHEDHDIQCDKVVTENSIYQTGPSEGDSKWK